MSARRDSSTAKPRPARRRGCVVLAVLAAAILGLSWLPLGPQHALIRGQLTRVLTELTEREVRVGKVSRSLWLGLQIDGLAIASKGGFEAGEPVASVETLGLRWNLLRLLFHLRDPLAAVSGIRADGAEVTLRRTSDGVWELVQLFQPDEPKPKPFTYAGTIDVVNGRVRLIDEAIAGRPVERQFDGVEARLKFNGRGEATMQASLYSPGLAEQVEFSDGSLKLEPVEFGGQIAIRGLRVGTAGEIANHFLRQWIELDSGTIESLTGRFTFAAGEHGPASSPAPQPETTAEAEDAGPAAGPVSEAPAADLGLDLVAQLDGVGVTVATLGRPLEDVRGLARVVLKSQAEGGAGPGDRIELEQVTARIGASRLAVSGTLTDYRRGAVYDLRVASRGWNFAEAELLMPQVKVLHNFADSGISAFELRLTGPVETLRIAGDLEPVNLHWSDLATLDGGRMTLDLRRVPPGEGLAGIVGGLELAAVGIATKFLARPLEHVLGGVRLGQDALGLQNLHARVDGAPLMVAGTITRVTQPGRVFDLRIETQGLTPAVAGPLLPPRLRPMEVRGGITADLAIQGPANALKIAGTARMPWFRTAQFTHLGGGYTLDLQLGRHPTGRIAITDAGLSMARLGGPVTGVNGVVRLLPAALLLDNLRARWAGGPLRADGRVALGRGAEHDLRLWTSGVEAAQVTGVLGRSDIRGRGRLAMDVRLQGTVQRLRVSGTAQVPWLRVPQATVAQADLRLDLAVEPRRGLFGLNGQVTARNTRVRADRLDAMVAVSRGTVRFDNGRLRLSDVRGAINDDPFRASGSLRFAAGRRVRLASLDLAVRADRLRPATVRRVAGDLAIWRQVALTAPVRADLRLSGPLDRLRIQGAVDVTGATLKRDPPLPVAANARLDLRLRPKGQPVGTIRVVSGHTVLPDLGLRVPEMAGLITLLQDGRIALGSGESQPFRALVGGSRLGVSGTVEPGQVVRLALMVNAESVRIEDLRAAAATLDDPPEIEGDETLGGFRLWLAGPLNRLRIATVGAAGETGAFVPLPERLTVAGYTVAGGLAGLDVILGEQGIASGEVLLRGVAVEVAATGTRGVVDGSVGLLDGRPSADLTALIDGRPVRVAGGGRDRDEVLFRVRADDVPVLGLLPQQTALNDALETDRLSTDLVIAGPLDDLAIAGTLALGGYQGLPPAEAEVHLRLVKPLDDPELTGPQPLQVLGGVRLIGGSLKLAALEQPLTALAGNVDVALDSLRFEGLSAGVEGSTVTLDGTVDLLDDPVLKLVVTVPGLDLAALLRDIKLPPADDPEGAPVDLFTAYGLPLLHTPEPLSGTVSVDGPLSQVAVGLDLALPLVVVDAADAISPGPAPPFDEVPEGHVLLRDATIRGTAIGSLRRAAELLPSGEDLAGALNHLAGLTLVAMPADETAQAGQREPSVLDGFVFGLTLQSDQLNPRQGFAFLSANAQAGVLSEAYAYQPGRGSLEVTGPLRDLRFRGDFDLSRVEIQQVPLRRLAAQFDYFDNLMTLDQVVLDVRGGQVTGHGAMALQADQPLDIAMELDIDRVEMAVLNRLQLFGDRELDLEGEANGTVQFHLSEEVPKVQGVLRLDGLRVVGESVGDGVVDFAVEKDLVVLRQVELIEPVGRSHARVRGRVGLGDEGVLDLLVDVRNLDLGRLAPLFSDPTKPAVTGRLDLIGAVTGSRTLPMVAGSGNIFFGSVAGMPFNRLSVRAVETSADSMRLTGELSDAAYQATLVADLTELNPREGTLRYAIDAEIDSIELAQALPQAGLAGDDSFGRVTGTAQFAGRVERQVTESGETRLNPLVDLTGRADLAAGDPDRPGRLVVGGVYLDTAELRLTASHDQVDVEALEIKVGSTRIGIDPLRTNAIRSLSDEPQVELHLVSDELRVEDLVTLTRLPLETEGWLQVAVDVTGELRDPVADVRLESHQFVMQGEPIGDRVIRATVARRVAVIEGEQTFELFGTELQFAGSLQDEAIDVRGHLEIRDVRKLRAFLMSLTEPVGERRRMAWQDSLRRQLGKLPEDLEGTPRLEARLVGTREQPTGYLELDAKDLHAGDRPVPPIELSVNVGIPTPRQPARFEDGVVYVYGSASLGEQGVLRLQARTDGLDLAPYGTWSPKLEGLHGQLSLAAQAIGTTEEPRLELQRLELTGVGVKQVSFAAFSVDSLVFRRGLLDLGTIALDDGSLQARLTGQVPVSGLSLRPRRSSPMALRLEAKVGQLAEFSQLIGAVDRADGSANVLLNLGGTPSALTLDGDVEIDLPELVLAQPRLDFTPLHRAALAGPYQELAAVTAELAAPESARRVWVRLVDNAVRLRIADNTITVDEFAFHSPPTDPSEPSSAGSLVLEPGGSIALPQPLDPARLGEEGLLSRPVDLRLLAVNVAGRTGSVQWAQVQADVAVEPQFSDGILNKVTIRDTGGWINGGLVTIAGNIRQRSASLANWWEQEYAVRLRTPPIDPASQPIPDNAAAPEWVAEGAIYPLTFEQRNVVSAKAIADLRLETRAGQTPPLTLAGDLEIFDAVIREGALALFAAPKRDGGPANWPATPELDLTLTARRNNWVRAKVPDLQVPVSGRMRLSQTPQQLKVEGTAQIGEGQLNSSFLKNRVAIRGGDAQFVVRRNRFTGSFEPFASFNARAETVLTQGIGGGDIERYDVALEVQGSARPGIDKPVDTELRVKADSSPPLAEERIFAMLSRKAEFAAALESGEIKDFFKQELANAALQTALSYALTPVFDELRQLLGLDVFTIRYELDRPLEIQASKYLLKRLLVTLFVEVGGPDGTRQTIKVDYEVAGGFRFGVQVDSDQEFRMTGEYSTRF